MDEVEHFILQLEPGERTIVQRLRSLILDSDPRIREKLSYGVPYFFHHRRICFLWPVSHYPCSEEKRKTYPEKVQMGFCYGNLLSNDQRLLRSDGRKQVYTIMFSSLSEIDDRAIREIVAEAILVDDGFLNANAKTKTRKRK